MTKRTLGLWAFILGGHLLAAPLAAEEAVLDRVVLSTGGVGYFEHAAEVDGTAEVTLDLAPDDLDDLLKSLVVLDPSGAVAQVTMPGRQPLAETFRDLPFDREALSSPTALLNALAGNAVEAVGGRAVEGRLVSVLPEETSLGDGRTTVRHRVTVMAADGLHQFLLEDAEAVRFADPDLRAALETALVAMAAHGGRDRRRLTVALEGEGRRAVRVGYVAAAPLWKASYRLILAEAGASRMQGWAVLENMTGADWRGVDLSLVSGNPVTFRQALYESYHVERPEVPVEVVGRILPPPDRGDMPVQAPMQMKDAPESAMAERSMARMAPAEDRMLSALPPAPTAGAIAIEAEAAAAQVYFDLGVPIDLDAGHSATLPILDRDLPGEEVALYRPETHPTHPMLGVRLRNDGDTALPPGAVTLYRGTAEGMQYVGDARLATLPRGEERILSFALDTDTRIDLDRDGGETVIRATLADGLLRLHRRLEEAARYRVAAPEGQDRTVVIEHPRRPGWDLAAPEEGVTVTEEAYRIERRVAAGAVETVEVLLVRPLTEEIAVSDLAGDRLAALARAATLDPATREAFARMADLRRTVEMRQQAVDEIERERQRILDDQARLRENLAAVPRDSDLARRYLAALTEQEDRLAALEAARAEAERALAAARRTLADFVAGLDLR